MSTLPINTEDPRLVLGPPLERMRLSFLLNTLADKMREYIANGARLGWLIDPYSSEVFIYLPSKRRCR